MRVTGGWSLGGALIPLDFWGSLEASRHNCALLVLVYNLKYYGNTTFWFGAQNGGSGLGIGVVGCRRAGVARCHSVLNGPKWISPVNRNKASGDRGFITTPPPL